MKIKLLIVSVLLVVYYSSVAQVSDQTMRDIQQLLNEKNSRTLVQQKIDCHCCRHSGIAEVKKWLTV